MSKTDAPAGPPYRKIRVAHDKGTVKTADSPIIPPEEWHVSREDREVPRGTFQGKGRVLAART